MIFVNINRCEIIETDKIPYLLNLIPWDYRINSMVVINNHKLSNISVPSKNIGGSSK